jgi:hypothetical protein
VKKETSIIMSATLALPLLAPAIAEGAVSSETNMKAVDITMTASENSTSPTRLTENQLDAVTSGGQAIECLSCGVNFIWYPKPKPVPIGPEPIWKPVPDYPPIMTTMALGEEGGGISPIFQIY